MQDLNEKQKHEELLQTLAAVNLQYSYMGAIDEVLSEHIKTVLDTCKIGDDSEVINGVRHFKFDYQVPEADCIAGLKTVIECQCKGCIFEGEPNVAIKYSNFEEVGWVNLWNANATYNKLSEAAKQHYINHYSNAKPIANSEEVVNNILGINNSN